MSQLILLGGPPGVGKSTIINFCQLNGFVCLEADLISPPDSNASRSDAILKVISATEKALSQASIVILAWVFAKSQLYQPFVSYFSLEHTVKQIYLICSVDELRDRLISRDTVAQIGYALEKRQLINRLTFDKIDTTGVEATDIARQLITKIQSDA